jgi:hypothetical protein
MSSKSGGINEQTENDVEDWGRPEVERTFSNRPTPVIQLVTPLASGG